MNAIEAPRLTSRPFGTFRLLLALAVIPQHIGSPFLTGTCAVYAFFALSGFVIMEAADKVYPGRAADFAVNRFLRIVPAFMFALVLAIAAYIAFVPTADLGPGNIAANFLALIPGIEPTQSFMPYAWAIKVELLFYAAVATSLALRLPLGPVAAAGFAFYMLTGEPDVAAYIPFFAFGVCCYRGERALAAACFIGCMMVAPELLSLNAPDPLPIGLMAGHLAMLGAMLLAIPALAAIKAGSFAKLDDQLGLLSFPIYLQQHTAIIIVSALAVPSATAVYAVTLGLALLTIQLVERPLVAVRMAVRKHRSAHHVIGGAGRHHIGESRGVVDVVR